MIHIGVVNGDVIEAGGVKNVTNNYYGKDAVLENAAGHDLLVSDDEDSDAEDDLRIALNKHQREILNAAVKEGIIVYNPERKGYDTGHQSSNVLVAYLCGRLSCGDYTDNDGTWIAGGRFNEAQYYKDLFGFDVDGTRRKARDNGAGKSPTGHERVDKLFI